jgi:uncharacterized membrane protein YbhN (UPF0104 family)
MRWELGLLSMGLILVCHCLNVARWQYILQEPALSYIKLFRLYATSLFGSSFLPSGIGGDGIRAALVSRNVSLPHAVFSVVFDRAVATASLVALLVIGLWFGAPANLTIGSIGAALTESVQIILGVVLALALTVLLLVLWRGGVASVQRRLDSTGAAFTSPLFQPGKLSDWFRLFGGSFVLSVVSQLSLVASYWLALQALNIQGPPSVAFWLVLIGSASLLLPISINGLGLQEGIYVVLLAAYAVPSAAALAFALLIRLLSVFFALLGGLLSLNWNLLREAKAI